MLTSNYLENFIGEVAHFYGCCASAPTESGDG